MADKIADELRAHAIWWRIESEIGLADEVEAARLDRAADALEAKDKRIAELEAALTPFSIFAEHSVEATDDGWVWANCQKDRICNWFGPSDFGLAKHFAPPSSPEGEANG